LKNWQITGFLNVLIIGFLLISGCTQDNNKYCSDNFPGTYYDPSTKMCEHSTTPTPQIIYITVTVTPNPTTTQTSASASTLTPKPTYVRPAPGPTQTLPDKWALDFQVGCTGDAADPQIMTRLEGGNGFNFIQQIDVKVTRPDGIVETGIIERPFTRGSYVYLPVTTAPGYVNRVEVWATTPQGDKVKIFDNYIPFRVW